MEINEKTWWIILIRKMNWCKHRKKILNEMGWSGWLVIERSRNAQKPSDTKYNYGANTAYLKKVFLE